MGIYLSNDETYLIIDDGNIDATLGLSVLGCRPSPKERPRWDCVLEDARRASNEEARGLFFLNDSSGVPPIGFVQTLTAMDYTVIPLSGSEDVKVVDVGLQRIMGAIGELESGDVTLASHDTDFVPQVEHLLGLGRSVAVMCSRGFLASGLHELEEKGLKVVDLEYDIHALQVTLPRLRITDVDGFDPFNFLRSPPGAAQADTLRVSVVAAPMLHTVFMWQSPQGEGSNQSALAHPFVYFPACEYAYRGSSDRELDPRAFPPQPAYDHASREFSDRLKEYPPRSTARPRPLEWAEIWT